MGDVMQRPVFQRLKGIGRRLTLAAPVLILAGPVWTARLTAQTPGVEQARELYNLGRYEAAIGAAEIAQENTQSRHEAALILGRAWLERHRQTADPDDLVSAREALRSVDPTALLSRDRIDLLVGLAEALYLDSRYRPAADLFATALRQADDLGPAARDQVLDWWATAVDRFAQSRPPLDRGPAYDAISGEMTRTLEEDPGSATATYWLVIAARAQGDLELAWDRAVAGWVRAQLNLDHGAAVRPDLDRLVVQALIPERAARLALTEEEREQAEAALISEWDEVKAEWTR